MLLIFLNNLNGKRIYKRTDICTCITESLCCIHKTNVTLLINYTQNNLKKKTFHQVQKRSLFIRRYDHWRQSFYLFQIQCNVGETTNLFALIRSLLAKPSLCLICPGGTIFKVLLSQQTNKQWLLFLLLCYVKKQDYVSKFKHKKGLKPQASVIAKDMIH